jgi:tetratricopeptide (TPR) repeat protein
MSDIPSFDATPWVTAFRRAPEDALDSLLSEHYLTPRGILDRPVEALRDWISADSDELLDELDHALAAWIERNWASLPDTPREVRRLSSAWNHTFDIVGTVGDFSRAAEALLNRIGERESYLWSLSSGPSNDPVGRFLLAIADYQADRRLAHMWLRLCQLPPEVPYYHAAYVMAGIIGLPSSVPAETGRFRREVAAALITIAEAFDRASDEDRVLEHTAREELRTVAALTTAAFPFPAQWATALAEGGDRLSARAYEWLQDVVAGERPGQGRRRSAVPPSRIPDWSERAPRIADELRRRKPSSLEVAERMLAEQRQHAETTGEHDPLVRSLCYFASSAWTWDAERATQWAEEAREWQPGESITWTSLVRALLLAGRHVESADVGWAAIDRFPGDEIPWNELGASLIEAKRFLEASEVYAQAVERFPHAPRPWRGLGDVLRQAGRYDDAEDLYRRALVIHPENSFLRTGLAGVLKNVGRFDESIIEYQRAAELNPTSDYPWRGLAMAHKAAGRLKEAEEALMQGLQLASGERILRNGLETVRALRRQHQGAERVDPEPLPPVPGPGEPPPLREGIELTSGDPDVRAGYLAAARTLRRAAQRETNAAWNGFSAGDYANRALHALTDAHPWQPSILGERVYAATDAHDGAALESLIASIQSKFAPTPLLAYPETRALRDLSVLRNGTSDLGVPEIVRPLRRLRLLDRNARLLELLVERRAAATLPGAAAPSQADIDDLLNALATEVATGSGFTRWWSERVTGYLRNGSGIDASGFTRALHDHRRQLDTLEEDFANRLTVGAG